MPKVLVTGANGFIGKAVSIGLLENGFEVVCAVRQSFALEGATIFKISDLDGQTDWSEALNDVDCIVHSAARAHFVVDAAPDPYAEFHKVNVDGTLNLAQQAAQHGIKRLIFLSSIKVNGEYTNANKPFTEDDAPNPQDGYSLSKHEAEEGLFLIAQKTGMEIVVIRPPLVYGPDVKANFATMMKAVQCGIPLPLGAIDNKRSFIYVGNLVSLIIKSISHRAAANQVFLASDGYDLSTTELLQACASALGVKARLLPVPQGWLECGARLLGKHGLVQRLCRNLQVDITKAKQCMGWVPQITVVEGLKATAIDFAAKD